MLAYFLSMSFFCFSISLYLFFISSNSITVVLYLLSQILPFWLTLSFLQIYSISSGYSYITFPFVVPSHFEMEPSLTISTLHPCLNIFVTLHAVFTFYVLLLFSRHYNFLFYFHYSLTVVFF